MQPLQGKAHALSCKRPRRGMQESISKRSMKTIVPLQGRSGRDRSRIRAANLMEARCALQKKCFHASAISQTRISCETSSPQLFPAVLKSSFRISRHSFSHLFSALPLSTFPSFSLLFSTFLSSSAFFSTLLSSSALFLPFLASFDFLLSSSKLSLALLSSSHLLCAPLNPQLFSTCLSSPLLFLALLRPS